MIELILMYLIIWYIIGIGFALDMSRHQSNSSKLITFIICLIISPIVLHIKIGILMSNTKT